MKEVGGAPLRVALVAHEHIASRTASAVEEVAAGLRETGHEPEIVIPRGLPEALMRRRGFTGPLTHVPSAISSLSRGGYHVAHTFSPPDAWAALAWRRLSGRPVVFGCPGVLRRDQLADRRLRLALLSAAVEDTDAVVAATAEARDALRRWMAVEPVLIEPRDGPAHDRLYRTLLGQT